MRYSEINEAPRTLLPIHKQGLLSASYAAFMCVMKPEDFIRLTVSSQEEYDKIFAQSKVDMETYLSSGHEEKNPDNYIHPPFLDVEYETGRVTAHEGRHRAAMVAKAGGTKYPCVIYMKTKPEYRVSYRIVHDDDEGGEGQKFNDEFASMNDMDDFENKARNFETALEIIQDKIGVDRREAMFYSITDVKSDYKYGIKMKGSPDHSDDPWKRMPWRMEHFPKQFVGQFDKSVVIPTSEMKFAPLKRRRR